MKRMITMGMLLASSLAVACGSPYTNGGKNELPTTSDTKRQADPVSGPSGPSGPPSLAPDPSDDGTTSDAGANGDAATHAADADAGADADAPQPAVTCADQPNGGAYFFRCSAAAPSITAGGAIEPGSYVLSGYWGAACSYEYGSAEVFVENGRTYMRYQRIAKSDLSQPGMTYTGTWELDATADGAISRTEVCDTASTGAATTGRYEQTGGTDDRLVFVFGDAAETWKKTM